MKPVLFEFPLAGTTVSMPAYGVAVSLGIAAVVLLVARLAPRRGLSREAILDLSFLLLLAGLGGARLLYVLVNAGDFASLCTGSGEPRAAGTVLRDCLAPLRIWDGGLIFYGGGLGAAAVAWRFARRRGWSFPVLGDLFAAPLALGHALGRLGCFFAGCCFGKVCQAGEGAPCAAFPPGSVAHDHLVTVAGLDPAAAAQTFVHPTQLYEAAGLLLLYFVLTARAPHKRFHGQILITYLLGYTLLRTVLEIYRGDLTRRFLIELKAPTLAHWLALPPQDPLFLTTAQLISLLLAAAATAALLRRRTQNG